LAGSQTLAFDILGNASSATRAFKDTAGTAALAARGATMASDAMKLQARSAEVSAGATLALARADKVLADAELGLARDIAVANAVLGKQNVALLGNGTAGAVGSMLSAAASGKAPSSGGGGGGLAPGIAMAAAALGIARTNTRLFSDSVSQGTPVWDGARKGIFGLNGELQLFGGALKSVGIPAFLSAATTVHLLTEAVIETSGTLIPAAIAFGAFGVAAIPTAQAIYTQMSNLHTVTTALGTQMPGLSGGFSRMAAAVQPQVYQLFGEALVFANSGTGQLQQLATGAGKVLDDLGARFVAATTQGNGFSRFAAKATSDLSAWGTGIGNVGGIIGNLLKVLPGYAEQLASVFDGVTHAIEVVTGSGLGAWVLGIGLAAHGALFYIGLLGTGLAVLASRGLALVATGALSAATAVEGLGVAGEAAAGGLLAFGGAAETAAALPWGWISIAAAGIGFLVYQMVNAKSAAQQFGQSLETVIQNSSLGNLGATIAGSLQQANAAVAQAQKDAAGAQAALQRSSYATGRGVGNLSDSLNAAKASAGQYKDVLTGLQQQQSLVNSRVGALAKEYGGQTAALALLNQAGITSAQITDTNTQHWAQALIEIKAQSAALNEMSIGAGRTAAGMNALGNSYITGLLPAMQKVTQAEDSLLSVITGGEQGFVSFQQAIGQIGTDFNSAGSSLKGLSTSSSWASLNTAASTLGVNIAGLGKSQALTALKNAADAARGSVGGLSVASLTLSGDFYNTVIPSAQKMFDALQSQNISAGNLGKVVATSAEQMLTYAGTNTAARSVIVDLINNALGPGTTTLKSLNQWVGTNSVSLDTMNGIVATSTINAGKLAGVLSATLQSMEAIALFQAHGGQKAWNTFTTDLTTGKTKSDDFKKSTQDVISQLLIQTNGSLPNAKKAFEDYVKNGLHLSQQAADTLWKQTLPSLAGKVTGTGTAALAAGGQIDKQFTNALKAIINVSPGLNKDIGTFSNSIITTGDSSTRTQGARAKLIKDLENSGLSAKAATGLVDGLERKIAGLKGKTVNVGVTASAAGSLHAVSTIPGGTSALNYSFLGAAGRAAGGMISGGTPGKDSVLGMLMPGEVVVPTSMVKAGAVDHLRGKLPGFAAGGGIDLAGPQNWVAGTESNWGREVALAWAQAADKKFQAALAKAAAGTQVAYSKIAGVTQWEGDVAKVLSLLGLPQADMPTVMSQIQTESGGNPNAINLTDSNAAAGTPSKGLMQVIAPTFSAYRSPSLSGNIYDPEANIYAGVNYAIHRYGNPGWLSVLGHGHGYAGGTSSARPGLALVGERGPELVNFRGGEQVIPGQFLPGGRGGGDVHVHLDNHGVIGSKAELDNWLTGSINNLARGGYLRYALTQSPSAR
jgi:hypothetical protein